MKTDEETEKHQGRCFKDRVADRVCHEGREVSAGFGNGKVMGDIDKRNFTGNVGEEPVCGRAEWPGGEGVDQSWNASASNIINAFKHKAPKSEPNLRGN